MAATEGQRIEIRKYPNRRYYDTARSRHVTLEEIQSMIRDGRDVRVTDSKTGEDITGKVLTQIILELDPPKLDVFPSALLHRLIRSNQQIVNEFVDKYFNQALSAFLDSQRQFEMYLRRAVGLGGAEPLNPWGRLMLGPLGSTFWAQESTQPAGEAPKQPPAPDNLGGVVDELRRELADLRQQVEARRRPRPPKQRKGRRH